MKKKPKIKEDICEWLQYNEIQDIQIIVGRILYDESQRLMEIEGRKITDKQLKNEH